MEAKSLDIIKNLKKKLAKIMPEIFVEDKIDWEKLKATLGKEIEFENERYFLNWAGKSKAFENLQLRSSKTLKPRKNESLNFDNTKNIFIEGENLEILKIIQKSYFGKIKVIYIDPPYNTGRDFIYSDNFFENKSTYQKRTGARDQNGNWLKVDSFRKNNKENGHYHSDWLTMMYSRLFLARNLLRNDGVIFVSIDDNEVHNLRLIMNEIFGEENFVGDVIRKTKSTTNDKKHGFNIQHENTLIFARKITETKLYGADKDFSNYKNPDNDPKGPWISDNPTAARTNSKLIIKNPYTGKIIEPPKGSSWRFSKVSFEKYVKEGKIVFDKTIKKGKRGFVFKRYLKELQSEKHLVNSLFGVENKFMNQAATKSLQKIFPEFKAFDFSKPVEFVEALLKTIMMNDGDIVLDFFAGSGTTGQAVFNLNEKDHIDRQFICVQLDEKCSLKSEAYQNGYATISAIARERLFRVSKLLNKTQKEKFNFLNKKQDLGFKAFKLAESNFKEWRLSSTNIDKLHQQLKLFTNININDSVGGGEFFRFFKK